MASSSSSFTPYTYIQCPCHDSTSQVRPADDAPSPTSQGGSAEDEDDDGAAFDPRAPRSNYSLYPLEYLLYCDVCHQIRCPRCVFEEIVNVYCPNCLFEVASSSLKTEGNRCTRSCFQCPICIGPLAVQALESGPPPEPSLLSADGSTAAPPSGPWILACSYCNWSSAEIGVKFDKPQGISAQLAKMRHGGGSGSGAGGSSSSDDLHHASRHSLLMSGGGGGGGAGDTSPIKASSDPETPKARFAAMKAFYQSQLAASNPNAGFPAMSDYGFNSPGTLSRIMSLYSGGGGGGGGPGGGGGSGIKQKSKTSTMREAEAASEGLQVRDLHMDAANLVGGGEDAAALARLRRDGWDGTVGREQAQWQTEEGPRFTDELWPVPYLLRSKRSKRCPVCRHIISKPESKVGNTRWRIRLVAGNYIPSISMKLLSNPLASPTTPTAGGGGGGGNGSGGWLSGSSPATGLLKPLQPVQFLLTFKNPIFEEVKVTLATPATTPGRFASRVTVLCPQFSIGANIEDMDLDDVLMKDTSSGGGGGGGGSGRHGSLAGMGGDEGVGSQTGEAGKIWERGRNWVSIVVEVIPASLQVEPTPVILRREGDPEEEDLAPLREDEDVLEIPMFVRLEWEGEVANDQVGKEKDAKEKRELAYWCALGIGRISRE